MKCKSESTLKLSQDREFRYEGLSLPNTTDLSTWGKIIIQDQTTSVYIQSKLKTGKQTVYFNIFKYKDFNLIQVFSNNTLLFIIKDYFINNNINPNTFIRFYNNNKIVYENGKIKSKYKHYISQILNIYSVMVIVLFFFFSPDYPK